MAVVVGAAKMRNGMAKAKNRQLDQTLEVMEIANFVNINLFFRRDFYDKGRKN